MEKEPNVYSSDDDKLLLVRLKERFPQDLEKSREGPKKYDKASRSWKPVHFTYIPNVYVSERLDDVVGLNWNWEVVDTKIITVKKEVKDKVPSGGDQYTYVTRETSVEQVSMLGRLTIHLPSGKSVFRDAWGGSDLDKGSQAGDAFKIADSNAFKKAAYKFGIASYLGMDGMEEAATSKVFRETPAEEGGGYSAPQNTNPFATKRKVPNIAPVVQPQFNNQLPQQVVPPLGETRVSTGVGQQGFNPFRK